MFTIIAHEAGLNFMVPLCIRIVQGRTPLDTAIAMMPFNLTVFFTAMLIVRLYDRLTPRQIARFAFILVTGALLWLAFVVRNNWETFPVILGLFAFGVGQGSLVTLLFNVLVTASPRSSPAMSDPHGDRSAEPQHEQTRLGHRAPANHVLCGGGSGGMSPGFVVWQSARRRDRQQGEPCHGEQADLQSPQSRLSVDPHRLIDLPWCRHRTLHDRKQPIVADKVDGVEIDLRLEFGCETGMINQRAYDSMVILVVLGAAVSFLIPLYVQIVQGRSSLQMALAIIPTPCRSSPPLSWSCAYTIGDLREPGGFG